jgi:hypothetical protein
MVRTYRHFFPMRKQILYDTKQYFFFPFLRSRPAARSTSLTFSKYNIAGR